MTFTLCFPDPDLLLSYRLIFDPAPSFRLSGYRDTESGYLPIPGVGPEYRRGGIELLVEAEGLLEIIPETRRKCVVVAFRDGHGSTRDLDVLREDLEENGFATTVVMA